MTMAKIAVSLPDAMLTEIDRVAREQQLARSEIIRQGVDAFLEIERYQRTLARAKEVYAAIAEEDLALAESYLPMIAETLPAYQVEEQSL
jgi:metal-responsive CopG/Arc/MetJ family transcriptional regulator